MQSEVPAPPVLPDFPEGEARRKINTSGQDCARKFPAGNFSNPQAHPKRQGDSLWRGASLPRNRHAVSGPFSREIRRFPANAKANSKGARGATPRMQSEVPAPPVLPDFPEGEARRKINTSGQDCARKFPAGNFSNPQAHPKRQGDSLWRGASLPRNRHAVSGPQRIKNPQIFDPSIRNQSSKSSASALPARPAARARCPAT